MSREKSLIMKQCYLYSNDGTLVLGNGNNGNKMVFSPCFILVDIFTINTLQLHKYIKDYLI